MNFISRMLGGGGGNEIRLCAIDELESGVLREIEVEGSKVLVMYDGGNVYATSNKCSHYGAPLIKGAVSGTRVRCPWHGACFDLKTGDIEDYPGPDSIMSFDTKIADGIVYLVIGDKASLKGTRRDVKMCSAIDLKQHFVIIGGGAAGVSCSLALRDAKFCGKITILCGENALPYDRTKLSKQPNANCSDLALKSIDYYASLNIDVKMRCKIDSFDATTMTAVTCDGEEIKADRVLIATGSSAKVVDVPNVKRGIFTLRSPFDGKEMIEYVSDRKHVVLVGSGFVGTELAAYFVKSTTATVTIVSSSEYPLARILGDDVGKAILALHESNGVRFMAKTRVKEYVANDDGALIQLILQNGEKIGCDACIHAVGIEPNTSLVSDLDKNASGFIKVDRHMMTSKAGVFAAGDCVEFRLNCCCFDGNTSIGHWGVAQTQGKVAALNMLGREAKFNSIPFFWTTQFGKGLRYAGVGHDFDKTRIIGDLMQYKFVCYYLKRGEVIAVSSMAMDPICSHFAELAHKGKKLTEKDLDEHENDWVTKIM